MKNTFLIFALAFLLGGCHKNTAFSEADIAKIEIGSAMTSFSQESGGGKLQATANIAVAAKFNGESEEELHSARIQAKKIANQSMAKLVISELTGNRENPPSLLLEDFTGPFRDGIFTPVFLREEQLPKQNKLVQIYEWKLEVTR